MSNPKRKLGLRSEILTVAELVRDDHWRMMTRKQFVFEFMRLTDGTGDPRHAMHWYDRLVIDDGRMLVRSSDEDAVAFGIADAEKWYEEEILKPKATGTGFKHQTVAASVTVTPDEIEKQAVQVPIREGLWSEVLVRLGLRSRQYRTITARDVFGMRKGTITARDLFR